MVNLILTIIFYFALFKHKEDMPENSEERKKVSIDTNFSYKKGWF